jgi:hypothetical protein
MTALSEGLIAIAVGTKARVAGWSTLLRAEAIDSVIATACQEAVEDEPDHDELWVHKDDAEHAKSILRKSSRKNGPSLW